MGSLTASMTDIDLSDLAHAYRLRPMSEAATRRAAGSARLALDPLLDVGGGTGTHATTWTDMGRNAVLLDLSSAMVGKAASNSHLQVVRAASEHMPFADASFGLAYFHLSIHYGDWHASLSEAVRVVRPGGRVEVWTFDPSDLARTSLGRWFPSVITHDALRFPVVGDLVAHLGPLVSSVRVTTTDETIERTARSWVESVRGRFVSTLQLINDSEIEAGITAFRRVFPADDDVYKYTAPFTTVTCVV